MDNKELSLEEILAENAGNISSDEEFSAETKADDLIEEVGEEEESLSQKRMLTADEILSGDSLDDIQEHYDKLTADEILADR